MLKDTFCSSPWYHLRINHAGYYVACRWDPSYYQITDYHISNTSLLEYMNSTLMKSIRVDMLAGKKLHLCRGCYYEDEHKKVSGRLKQLLKSTIDINNFDKTFCSSPHYDLFKHSYENQGALDNPPVDLQIDLGNTCNSACIMCYPVNSSRLEDEYIKLSKIEPILFQQSNKYPNWSEDPKLVEKFIDELKQISNIKYLHLLGGETLYQKSFYDICNQLINTGLSKNIIMGTTTNATVYNQNLEHIIGNFKQVHLGISIESTTGLNDYIRWPSQIDQVLDNIKKLLELRKQVDVQLSLRITPNVFTIYHIDLLFDFMIENNIIAESCNLLTDPSCLRIELLPDNLRANVLEKIERVINQYGTENTNQNIVNRRRNDLITPVISNVICEYKKFLETYTAPADVEEERYKLVKFIKAFESLRNNTILDYLPEYEEFLRSYGY